MATEWKCVNCGKKFKIGEWTCSDGIANHVVEPKTYRSLDAPTDPWRPANGSSMPIVRGRTMVCNIPPPKKVMEGGEVRMVGEGSVEFLNGVYASSDPEIQYWLDKKPGYNATEEQWKNVWLTKDELLDDERRKLINMQQRLEHERNELLAMTKQKVSA